MFYLSKTRMRTKHTKPEYDDHDDDNICYTRFEYYILCSNIEIHFASIIISLLQLL